MRSIGWRQHDMIGLSIAVALLISATCVAHAQPATGTAKAAVPATTPQAASVETATPQAGTAVPGGSVTGGSPFQALRGSWSGAGLIQLENGKNEAIRCKAYYTTKAAGARLGMSIRCASPSNKIDLRAGLDLLGAGKINGTWEERTFNANGTAVGQASNSSMRLQIDGTLSGTVSVVLDGKSQQVSIFSSNAGLNGVTIRLQKSRS